MLLLLIQYPLSQRLNGVANSPEGELLLYSVQSLFFDMQNVSYPFLKLSLRESWRVSA